MAPQSLQARPSATPGRSPRRSDRWHPCGCTPAGERGRRSSYVEASAEEALDVADDQIDPLLDEGWRPEEVALLTTGARHPEQVALQESDGQDGYWRTFWDKDCVFYGHVLGCKGLERKVVVLCVNERMPRERSRERLYVGFRGRPTSSSSWARRTSSATWVDPRSRRSSASNDSAPTGSARTRPSEARLIRETDVDDRFTSAPTEWTVATERSSSARWISSGRRSRRRRSGHLASYYRRDGNYAGATFLDLDPVDPYAFTAADLCP